MLTSLLTMSVIGAGGVGLWWNKRRNPGSSLEERFESWIMGDDGVNSNLKKWVAELSEEEGKTLVNRLVLHCAESSMDLEWLFGEELNHQDLRDALQDTVVDYLTSCMSAAQAAEDARAFKVYRAFDKKPKSKFNQELGRKLYAKLVDDGVISVSTEALLDTSNKKRQKHIVSTIRQCAADNPVAFYHSLKAELRKMDPLNEKTLSKVEASVEATPEPAAADGAVAAKSTAPEPAAAKPAADGAEAAKSAADGAEAAKSAADGAEAAKSAAAKSAAAKSAAAKSAAAEPAADM